MKPVSVERSPKLENEQLKPAEVDEPYLLDEDLGYLIGRVFAKNHRNCYQELSDLDITPQQYVVMVKLLEKGATSQNELGLLVGMKPVTIHGIIRILAARGLIETHPHEKDRRLHMHSVSDAGKEIVNELVKRVQKVGVKNFAPLNPTEQETLRHILKKLLPQDMDSQNPIEYTLKLPTQYF